MNEITPLTMADIPPETAAELERLHALLLDLSGVVTEERRHWAQERIDHIHKLFFMGAVYIKGEIDGHQT